MTTPGAQHNRAQDGGQQNITGNGDINDRSDNRQYTFVTLPAVPPERPQPLRARLLRPVPLVTGGVLLAAVVALAVGGRTWFGTQGEVADAARPGAQRPSAAPPGPSRSTDPSGTATPKDRSPTPKPSTNPAPPERKRPAEPSASGARELEASPISAYPSSDVYCGEWRGSGSSGLDISPCVQAVDHKGTAQFGVKVRNTRSEQAVVSVDVAWLRQRKFKECETGSALRQHVVIDPDTTWYSPLSCSADAVEGYAVQAAAWAVLDPDAELAPRTHGTMQRSRTAQIQADGTVVPPKS
ncbi:hypothetical protein [Streptomyces chattanoogensis]|uniref:Uncharacterized protein n=1 Tax=Streptomyces chattanoogensis TaxID=66876 RepID=A0A0N0XRV5_9ACTN|nr:hypothetical protein [Streptomyces chattanoogensis]KPC59826.1 hypothetical protein ADL29_32840 [Streptomyces chattanoogensis]